MSLKHADELYDEMWRVIGDLVFTLHDRAIELKHIVMADMLRTALTARLSDQN